MNEWYINFTPSTSAITLAPSTTAYGQLNLTGGLSVSELVTVPSSKLYYVNIGSASQSLSRTNGWGTFKDSMFALGFSNVNASSNISSANFSNNYFIPPVSGIWSVYLSGHTSDSTGADGDVHFFGVSSQTNNGYTFRQACGYFNSAYHVQTFQTMTYLNAGWNYGFAYYRNLSSGSGKTMFTGQFSAALVTAAI
jgi:hypothetical protein